IGLMTNVVLNLILLPRFGLLGAVWATAAANFTALALIYRFDAWLGMKVQGRMLLVSLLPLALGLGPWVALAVLAVVLVGMVRTNWILSANEKERLVSAWRGYTGRSAHKVELAGCDGLALALPSPMKGEEVESPLKDSIDGKNRLA